MSELRIVVPGRPPGANDLIRMGHWRIGKVRALWKAKASDAAELAVLAADPEGYTHSRRPTTPDGDRTWPLQRVQVGVTWRCKLRRRRDWDNLVSGIKPLLDGLVSAGIIADDSTDHLVLLAPLAVEIGAEADETILTVWRIEDPR